MIWHDISTAPKRGWMWIPVYLDRSKKILVKRKADGFWFESDLGLMKWQFPVHAWMPYDGGAAGIASV